MELLQGMSWLDTMKKAEIAGDTAAETAFTKQIRAVPDASAEPFPICGGSYIRIEEQKDSPLSKFLVEHFPLVHDAYLYVKENELGPGLILSFLNGDQSYDRNRARCLAFSQILERNGIRTEVMSYYT